MMQGKAVPTDWTNGAGTTSAGGTITVTAEPYRQGIYVQNLDTTALTIVLPAVKASDGTSTSGTISLAPAGSAGAAGGVFNSYVTGFFTSGPFTVVGTANKQCAVMTN